ncbi:hypothetical protein SAMN04488131_103234 [Flavobacterium xueshanense]|uniref:Uncharacterized protein n=1 Tax=Flavobacterium xueshanense TaxID=935223 RepID=A0A1I2D175_9FLAO|nr:hypothetical protein SAMN04488131_103234 [Flavobacterium xueshanense]
MDERRDATQIKFLGSFGIVTSFKHNESVIKLLDFFSFEK